MHDWLRGALDQVPLLHGGVRSVVERCTTPGEAFWTYDLPELVAWVALARSAERGVPLRYAQALVAELAKTALAAPTMADPVERAATHWRRSAAFAALASLGDHADAFEPFDARRVARAQEQVFLNLHIGELLQGVFFAPAEIIPMPTAQSQQLRDALADIVGDWAARPADLELQRLQALTKARRCRTSYGLARGGVDDDHDVPTLEKWSDVLAIAGVVEAPDYTAEELLPQMESPRDLLIVRCSDLVARGLSREIPGVCDAIASILRESLDEAMEDARASIDRLSGDEGLRALPASLRRWNRAAAACALECGLAQSRAVDAGPLNESRLQAVGRWCTELGDRIEVWCSVEGDDRALMRVRNAIRASADTRDTVRPEER